MSLICGVALPSWCGQAGRSERSEAEWVMHATKATEDKPQKQYSSGQNDLLEMLLLVWSCERYLLVHVFLFLNDTG